MAHVYNPLYDGPDATTEGNVWHLHFQFFLICLQIYGENSESAEEVEEQKPRSLSESRTSSTSDSSSSSADDEDRSVNNPIVASDPLEVFDDPPTMAPERSDRSDSSTSLIQVVTPPSFQKKTLPAQDANLCAAAKKNDLAAAQAAVAAGANVNCIDLPQRGGSSPLWYASMNGNLEFVKFLVASGARVQEKSDGETALHAAASAGHVEVCQWLLQQGADKRDTNKAGMTPAALARSNGWTDCCNSLS